jgi:hypothetical protein
VLKKKNRKFLFQEFAKAEIQFNWLDQYLFIPGDGNPGFDIVSFEIDPRNNIRFAVCIECRYSQPNTILNMEDVVKNYQLAVDQITRKNSILKLTAS